jgi:hypothetical protein
MYTECIGPGLCAQASLYRRDVTRAARMPVNGYCSHIAASISWKKGNTLKCCPANPSVYNAHLTRRETLFTLRSCSTLPTTSFFEAARSSVLPLYKDVWVQFNINTHGGVPFALCPRCICLGRDAVRGGFPNGAEWPNHRVFGQKTWGRLEKSENTGFTQIQPRTPERVPPGLEPANSPD